MAGKIRTAARLAANIATLGGHSRLMDAKSKYDGVYQSYKSVHDEYLELISLRNNEIEQVGELTKQARDLFKESERLLRNFSNQFADINSTKLTNLNVLFDSMNEFTIEFDSTVAHSNTAILEGAALSTAGTLGAWTLVTSLGTASTGTAIGSLSGAAGTNAALAWFGGGSLATGGAGMAGGSMVLGGLLALPLVAYSAYKSHDKASKIDSSIEDLNKLIKDILINTDEIKAQCKSVIEKRKALAIDVNDFLQILEKTKQELYPFSTFSHIFRKVKSAFGYDYFTKCDIEKMVSLKSQISILLNSLGR